MKEGGAWERRWMVGELPVQWVSRDNGRAHCFSSVGMVNGNAGPDGHSVRVLCTHQSHPAKGLRAFAHPSPRTNPKEAWQPQGCIHILQEQTLGPSAAGKEFSQQLIMVHRENQLYQIVLISAPRAGDVR